jgi:hypothetical protein
LGLGGELKSSFDFDTAARLQKYGIKASRIMAMDLARKRRLIPLTAWWAKLVKFKK